MQHDSPLLPRPPDLATYRELRGDPSVWLPAMKVICQRHGLEDDALFAERTGTNVLFRVGRGPWIKLFPPLWAEDALREQVGLETIAAVEGIEVPRLLAEGVLEDWPYVIISHVEGRPLRDIWQKLDLAARNELGEQIGRLMARLQALDISTCKGLHEDESAFLAKRVQEVVARNRWAGAEPSWLEALETYAQSAASLLDRPFQPVFLHADLTDDHLLATQRGDSWKLTGLIDLGDATVGDPLYEFAAPVVFLAQRRPTLQRALLRGCGLTDSDGLMGERIRAWALLHRFSLIPELIRQCPEPMPRDLGTLLRGIWKT